MNRITKPIAVLTAALLLAAAAGCGSVEDIVKDSTPSAAAAPAQATSPGADSAPSSGNEPETLEDPVDESKEATGEFTVAAANAGGTVESDGSVWTVKSAGEYTVTGSLENGQIIVDAGDEDEVVLILSNTSITSADGAPILILSAGEATVRSGEGTYNTVYDARSGEPTSEDEEYNAAIWSDCDLKLTGKGTLIVTSDYDNGVKSKDDLSVKNVTLKVTSPGVALKGNDTVTVESGELILISTGADGIKTANSDISSKGNQRGTVSILGGHVDIYAACDGISAAYNADIAPADDGCTVNIYTASYADGADSSAASEIYLVVPSSLYSESSDYYFYFYNDDDTDGVWVRCEYDTMIRGGMNASYYGLLASVPSGYRNVLVNTVASGETPDGANCTASSGGETVNAAMNGYLITDIASGTIAGDWVSISSGSGGSSGKTTYSSKGIKAANEINVSGGTVTVYSADDAMHANSGVQLENGDLSTGCITIDGGDLYLTSADDGIHADGSLTVNGGYIDVAESHEGLEANVITINGGYVYVYADDDGLNATSGSRSPLIDVTGGYLEVATPSGDTDAIDSNGSFTVSGGFVLVRGGASNGGMAGSVDVDGGVTVTGGTVVALGGVSSTPSGDSVNTFISGGTSFSGGEYALTDSSGKTLFTFSLTGSYNSCWIASELISTGGSYTLTQDGSEVLSWTQSSQTEGSAGAMGGPGGMFGGGPGGMFGGR